MAYTRDVIEYSKFDFEMLSWGSGFIAAGEALNITTPSLPSPYTVERMEAQHAAFEKDSWPDLWPELWPP